MVLSMTTISTAMHRTARINQGLCCQRRANSVSLATHIRGQCPLNYRTLFYTVSMPPRPQRTPSEDIFPGVVRAALELMTEEGPEGLTVRALARRAGVAP